MAFYIKVTKEVADRLHLTDIRNRTADGNVLLWQADVARFPGDTVFDRAKEAGGVCLPPEEKRCPPLIWIMRPDSLNVWAIIGLCFIADNSI